MNGAYNCDIIPKMANEERLPSNSIIREGLKKCGSFTNLPGFPSQKAIAKELGVCPSTINRAMMEMGIPTYNSNSPKGQEIPCSKGASVLERTRAAFSSGFTQPPGDDELRAAIEGRLKHDTNRALAREIGTNYASWGRLKKYLGIKDSDVEFVPSKLGVSPARINEEHAEIAHQAEKAGLLGILKPQHRRIIEARYLVPPKEQRISLADIGRELAGEERKGSRQWVFGLENTAIGQLRRRLEMTEV